MNDSQNRKKDKFDREDVFVLESADDFPKNSPVDLLTKAINIERQKILDFDVAQSSGFGNRYQAQEIYDNTRDQLLDLIDIFVDAAAIVDDDIEGTAEKFKNPYPRTDQNIITTATMFYNESAGIEAELTAAELPAGSRELLIILRDKFQSAAADHDSAEEHHAGATAGMADSFKKAMALSAKRAKRVKMKYRSNAEKTGAWTTASHLDRAPKSSTPATPKNIAESVNDPADTPAK